MEYFEKKDEPQILFVSDIIDCKKRGYLNAQKARVRTLTDSKHVKVSERLHKSESEYFLSYFFITLKENQLQKFGCSTI